MLQTGVNKNHMVIVILEIGLQIQGFNILPGLCLKVKLYQAVPLLTYSFTFSVPG